MGVNSFKDLIVYQKAHKLAMNVFELSTAFPKEEKYSLTDQIRRSSRSVSTCIAESWAKRRYIKHFISKLTDSLGEEYETEDWPYEIQLNKLHKMAMRIRPNIKLFLLMG